MAAKTKQEILKSIEGFGFPEIEIAITFTDFFEGNNNENKKSQPTYRLGFYIIKIF